jgi:hypothetical protein
MKPILSTLTAAQKDALVSLCEQHPYLEAARLAQEQLGLKLSASTLSRLYTTHKIAEDKQTREDYACSGQVQPNQILQLAADQLQLRLLELASRPNPGASELRALFQIITRLEALKLSDRRVTLAEQREARIEKAQNPPPKPSLPPAEIKNRIRVLLGKEPLPERAGSAHPKPSMTSSFEMPRPSSKLPGHCI